VERERRRVDLDDVPESLILAKRSTEEMHEGRQTILSRQLGNTALQRWTRRVRFAEGSKIQIARIARHQPTEFNSIATANVTPLPRDRVCGPDGTREDVTALCRSPPKR